MLVQSNVETPFCSRIQAAAAVWYVCVQLEVPLLYYFPPEERDMTRDGRAKSFVYEIRDHPTDPSRQMMEILVNTGQDVGADQLRVEVDDNDALLITAEKATFSGHGQPRRYVIKRYTLPPLADVDAITSRPGVDGRLTILIPIRRKWQIHVIGMDGLRENVD